MCNTGTDDFRTILEHLFQPALLTKTHSGPCWVRRSVRWLFKEHKTQHISLRYSAQGLCRDKTHDASSTTQHPSNCSGTHRTVHPVRPSTHVNFTRDTRHNASSSTTFFVQGRNIRCIQYDAVPHDVFTRGSQSVSEASPSMRIDN